MCRPSWVVGKADVHFGKKVNRCLHGQEQQMGACCQILQKLVFDVSQASFVSSSSIIYLWDVPTGQRPRTYSFGYAYGGRPPPVLYTLCHFGDEIGDGGFSSFRSEQSV